MGTDRAQRRYGVVLVSLGRPFVPVVVSLLMPGLLVSVPAPPVLPASPPLPAPPPHAATANAVIEPKIQDVRIM